MFYCTWRRFHCHLRTNDVNETIAVFFFVISLFLPLSLSRSRLHRHSVWLHAIPSTYSVHEIGNLISFEVLNELDFFSRWFSGCAAARTETIYWFEAANVLFLPNMEFIAISVPFFNVLLRNRNVPAPNSKNDTHSTRWVTSFSW